MRRMVKRAMKKAAEVKAAQTNKVDGWTISWDTREYQKNSMVIAGRCVAIELMNELKEMEDEDKVFNLSCKPYLDLYEIFSDDPRVVLRASKWK